MRKVNADNTPTQVYVYPPRVEAMSDIFISYSKADHALALKLSAFLEAEEWSVWYDKNLGAADLYRDEIMKQLAAARAVITIWTPNSIKSDWVRAEAGHAKKEGKLIPVKTTDVAYGDIPLPFGEMHTENIGSTELIRAAVVAQLQVGQTYPMKRAGPEDYKQLAKRCAEIASECSAPTVAEALRALALDYLTRAAKLRCAKEKRGRRTVKRAASQRDRVRRSRVSISEPTTDKLQSGQLRSVTPLKAK